MNLEALRLWTKLLLLWTSVVSSILTAMAVAVRYYVELRIGRVVSDQAKGAIASLQTELGQRKAEIGELQSRTAARQLTDAQRETMTQMLAKAPGRACSSSVQAARW